jgi:hypothetical protein
MKPTVAILSQLISLIFIFNFKEVGKSEGLLYLFVFVVYLTTQAGPQAIQNLMTG